ncbi:hypothetical protein LCGC14_0593750 [marine sediment metagenome]|uniref:Uncharacterized protein n=1 Tax=marine sediment metagenome TaxID=412755 RepID=A0A0F9RCR9_9ZZZZ
MENKNELADALLYIVTLCGYYPLSENDIDVLVKYINKDDPTLSVLKLKEMFDCAIKDKLGIELKGRLSAKEYLRVKYAWGRNFQVEQKIQKPNEPTEEQKEKMHKDWLENCIFKQIDNFYKTGDYKITDYGNSLYNYLERIGLLTFSEETKAKFFKREKIALSQNSSSLNEPISIKTIINQSDKITKMNYKKYALEQFLRTCKEEKRDIVGEIKSYEQKLEYENATK